MNRRNVGSLPFTPAHGIVYVHRGIPLPFLVMKKIYKVEKIRVKDCENSKSRIMV